MHVKRLTLNRTEELFEIKGRDRTIYLRSNRPLLQFKGLKHFPAQWRPEGIVKNQYHFEAVIKALEKKLKELEK